MNFISDNVAGAVPEVLAALARANSGIATSYGDDKITGRLKEKLATLFERDVAVFPVATGTAANALALATLTPHFGAIYCHEGSHIHVDECGAPEFYSGAKLIPIAGPDGKLTVANIEKSHAHFIRGNAHQVQPATISITQATERGTVYTPAEIRSLSEFAAQEKLSLHMDGARFANAVAHLRCSPAELTWKAGVDALSFGMTKNGALGAEAVIFFDPARAQDIAYRRKKAGHLVSKMRFLSAQIEAMLDDGLWLKLAGNANTMAARLNEGLKTMSGFAVEHPVEANEVFAKLPSESVMKSLENNGAKFYLWEPVTDGRPLIRLICSFATSGEDVDAFLRVAKSCG